VTTREGDLPMWTVVYIAPNLHRAGQIKEELSGEGMLVQLRPANKNRPESGITEVLVPEAEAEEAHEILTTLMGS